MDERLVRAVHGWRPARFDSDFEIGFANYLRRSHDQDRLIELYGRFADGTDGLDGVIRRAIWRAMARSFGHGVTISPRARFRHLETVEIGDEVFIGPGAMLWGSPGGVCRIGNHVWIGPRVYLDARALVIEDCVSWGPGARLSAPPRSSESIEPSPCDAHRLPTVVERSVDIGAGATILPGVTIGSRASVLDNAIVSCNVEAHVTVPGAPEAPIAPSESRPERPPVFTGDVDELLRRAIGGED